MGERSIRRWVGRIHGNGRMIGMTARMKTGTRVVAALLASFVSCMFAACEQDDTVAVAYEAYNHTATPIDAVVVNGEGGILNATPFGGGGGVCCVVLPSKWRPGLNVLIKWQRGGHWERDLAGRVVEKDGRRQFVEGEWKERTVEVPEYVGGDQTGRLHIHFFLEDDVRVTVLPFGPGHKNYPYPYPEKPRAKVTR